MTNDKTLADVFTDMEAQAEVFVLDAERFIDNKKNEEND